jgi:hypothetical protein
MTRLAAVLVGTSVVLALAYSVASATFAPLVNWLGTVVGVPLLFLLGMFFLILGNPLQYPIVLASWVVAGILVAAFARKWKAGLLAAFATYGLLLLVFAVVGIVAFVGFFPRALAGASSNPTGLANLPPIPPGSNLATIEGLPVINGIPEIINALNAHPTLSSFGELVATFYALPWIENLAVFLFTAGLCGAGFQRVSRRLKAWLLNSSGRSSGHVGFQPATLVIVAVLLLSAGLPALQAVAASTTQASSDLNFTMNGSYSGDALTLNIIPTSGFFILSQDGAQNLISGVISGLKDQGFSTPSGFLLSVASSEAVDSTSVELLDAVIAAPSDATGLLDTATIGGVTGYALTSYQAWSDLTSVAPPDIVTAAINNMLTGLSLSEEQIVIQNNEPICNMEDQTTYSPAYIAGLGQKLVLTVSGITPPTGNSFAFVFPVHYAIYSGTVLHADYQCGSSGLAIGAAQSSISSSVDLSKNYFLWIFFEGWSVSVTLTPVLNPTLLVPPGSETTPPSEGQSSPFTEAVLGLVNPDGSETNLYAFVQSLEEGASGMFSNIPALAGADFVILITQTNYLAFLPSSVGNLLSSYTGLVPSTIVIMGYSQDCALSASLAARGALGLSSELDLQGLQPMASSSFPTNLNQVSGGEELGCIYVYASNAGLGSFAGEIAGGFLPAVHRTGLISTLEYGLDSGYLVPGETPSSSEGTVLVLGSANQSFVASEFESAFPFLTRYPTISGQTDFALALTEQTNAIHSSSMSHTATLAQILGYNSTLAFANDASFSMAGMVVPTSGYEQNPASGIFPTGGDYVIYTNNETMLGSVLSVPSGSKSVQVSANTPIEPAEVSASFAGLFPANLQLEKSVSPDGNGVARVMVTLKNLDSEPITNVSFDDRSSLQPYGKSVSLTSGNPFNSSTTTLYPGESVSYSYTVGFAGIGSYVFGPADVSYSLNGTDFGKESNSVVWNQPAPGTASGFGILLSEIAEPANSLIAIVSGNANLGGYLFYGMVAVIVLVAAVMEMRSFERWRRT